MSKSPIRRNRGAVLLIFMLITITASTALLLKAFNLKKPSADSSNNRKVLIQAKEALIGYALSYADKINPNALPGFLPCPDTDGDGFSNAPCGAIDQSGIGRLPWQTLGLQALRDNQGACLWYAVSGKYKDNPAGSLSTDAEGQFLLFDDNLTSLNGNNFSQTSLAIVFAPGAAVNSQNRTVSTANATECGSTIPTDGINQSQNYLENFAGINNANGRYAAGVLNGIPIFPVPTTGFSTFMVTGAKPDQNPKVFNDSLLKITATDFQPVYKHMQRWIGNRVRQCLQSYYNSNGSKLPWPALLSPPGNPAYNDNASQQRFGRIASNLSNTTSDGLNPLWPMDPLQPGVRCFNWGWWSAVSESVFYALDHAVTPLGTLAPFTLTVDASVNPIAILVAGPIVGNQSRLNGVEKGSISNYLETGNLVDSGSGTLPPGNENFISSDNAPAFFNDYVCTLTLCP